MLLLAANTHLPQELKALRVSAQAHPVPSIICREKVHLPDRVSTSQGIKQMYAVHQDCFLADCLSALGPHHGSAKCKLASPHLPPGYSPFRCEGTMFSL